MMKTFRKALHAYLKSLTSNSVCFQRAPDTASFPYVVYDFQIYNDGEGTQQVTLDIDIWDDQADTTRLETLASAVDVNKKVITTDDLSVVFYLESKMPLTDEDPAIKRRRYSYIGYLHERS